MKSITAPISSFRIVALTGIATSVILVGGCVIVVALRGHGTHLGSDTVGLVFASAVGLVAASVSLLYWDRPRRTIHAFVLLVSVVHFRK